MVGPEAKPSAFAGDIDDGETASGHQPPAAPPTDRLNTLLAETYLLVARYTAVVTAYTEVVERLTEVRESHRAHADALVRWTCSRTHHPLPGEARVDPAGLIGELRAAEQTAFDSAHQAFIAAPDDEPAELMGVIIAARASHLEALSWPPANDNPY
jgi:hypothetical protein